jgi:hypothetical protein
MTDNTEDKVLSWGEHKVEPSDVPAQSLFALAQRGFTHVLGNEVAASISAWKKTEEGTKATETETEAKAKSIREAKLAKIMDGTLGVRTAAGPRVSGVEAIMRSIAVERLRVKLKKHDLVLPTGEKTVTVAGKPMNRDALIAAELRHGEKAIREEATRRQAAQAEAAEGLDDIFAEG